MSAPKNRLSLQSLVCTAVVFLLAAVDPAVLLAQASSDRINLAVVAEPSASYVSGDTSVDALNDGREPSRSGDRRRGSYGNWPRTGTQWVQYEWDQPIRTERIDVYWWMDGQGIHPPSAYRVLYEKDGEFVPVESAKGLAFEADQFNTTTFDEVETAKLRLEIDSDGENSTGILEWRVYDAGGSPKFAPQAIAGIDRVVVEGGKTYLNGQVKSLYDDGGSQVRWSKKSGPGDVNFEDPNSLETTATFSEVGDYELSLTASEGELEASSALKVCVVAGPPEQPLHSVVTRPYKVSSLLWRDRLKATIVTWIPYCIEKIEDPDLAEGGMNNIVSAANKLQGKPYEPHRGYVFSNAWVLNIAESMCWAVMVDAEGDAEIVASQAMMRSKLDEWIPQILAAQEADGYFQTAFTLPRGGRGGGNLEHWTRRPDHEGYVAVYFIDAAMAHYLLTEGEDTRFYDAARRLADCWVANIGPPPKKEWYNGHQAMEMSLVAFGRLVNEVEGQGEGDQYVELGKFLLDSRRDGSEYDQSHVPVQQQYEAVGHAVRAVYSYAGMAEVARETGDRDYLSAVMSLHDNIANKKYYVTGGIGSGETSEGFGPNYSLRNRSYCESCSGCGQLFFQHKLNLIYHAAHHGDLAEETLFNAILGDLDLAGENFYYQNPLDSDNNRYPWHVCPCCVGNIPRTLLMLPTWMYAKSDDAVYVNQFAGSTVDVGEVAGTELELVQETDYPWKGDVTITVHPAEEREFTIYVRSPQRSVSELYTSTPEADGIESLAVNGQSMETESTDGYVAIKRTWKPGDKIEMELPLVVQRVHCIDKVEANRGRVALRYGPLVYNIESVDQDVNSVLPPEAELTTEWRPDLLNGVVVIQGEFADGSPMLAIPNYARQNRNPEPPEGRRRGGGGRSIVWIREE